MRKNKVLHIFIIAMIILILLSSHASALSISEACIEDLGKCEMHLQYWKESSNRWSYIITTLAGYRIDGNLHYAYCMQREKPGVGDVQGGYSVKISEILQNETVWRAIINGFPYKSASDLSVYNDEDAFVATKQAIYCVLYNWDPSTRYRGADERGWQIYNAINSIVNKARTGNQTHNNSNVLNIQKTGDFVKSKNNFYSQEFIVTSNLEMESYSVTDIKGFPDGSYITDVNLNSKNDFSSNEHFKLLIPEKNILNDFSGRVYINGKVKSYPIFYGSSYDQTLQDYALTYDSFDIVGDEVSFSVSAHKSSLRILKVDSKTSLPLANVEFNLKYENGADLGNFITDENGVIEIDSLLPGKILVTELKTQNQYILDGEVKEIILNYNDNIELELSNIKENPPEPTPPEVEEPPKIEEPPKVEEPIKLPVTGY